MLVLSFVTLCLVVNLILNSFDSTYIYERDAWNLIKFGILLIAHNLTGLISWEAHYHSFANRLMWTLAVCLYPMVYVINWQFYAGLTLTGGDDAMLRNLVAIGVIVMPSLLVFGGPFNAVVNPPSRAVRDS